MNETHLITSHVSLLYSVSWDIYLIACTSGYRLGIW